MANQRQRERKLEKGIAEGKKELTAILSKRKRAISGAVWEGVSATKFMQNAATRERLYSEIAKEYATLDSDINDWVVSKSKVTSKNWWNYAKEDLPNGSVSGTFGQFSNKHVENIIGMINPSTVSRQVAINANIGGMAQNSIRSLRAAVSTTLSEASVEGLTNPQMAQRMLRKVGAKNLNQLIFTDRAGRKWSAERYFSMLNQTLHSNVARQSYIATATDAGFDLFQIEGGVTGSSLENASDPCDEWAGKIISMTGSTKGYPTYQDALDAGVFHPQCLHFLSAVPPSEMPAAKKQEKVEEKQSDKVADKREESE